MTLLNFATSVDYNLLQQQKLTLINLLSHPSLAQTQVDDLDGILGFLDGFQDAIVESHIKPEDEVFAI